MFSVRGLLIDVTGVLYEFGSAAPISGSLEAIALLRNAGIPFRLVSNESQCSTAAFLKKLHKLGYSDITQHEVFLPAPAAATYIRENKLSPYFILHPEAACEFAEFAGNDDREHDSVLIGDAAEFFSFEKVNSAFNVIMRSPQPTLLTLGYGRYYKNSNCLNLDVGPYAELLRFAVGPEKLKPVVFGKPSPNYFNAAMSDLKIPCNELAMIGDDVMSDVIGAMKCGMHGILVQTGKYKSGDELGRELSPSLVVKNFLAAVNFILKDKH